MCFPPVSSCIDTTRILYVHDKTEEPWIIYYIFFSVNLAMLFSFFYDSGRLGEIFEIKKPM